MDWKIPLYDLTIGKEEISAITKVLKSQWISMGEETKKFEVLFSENLNISLPGLAVNSGTAALHTAMKILDIGPGDEVLVPSMTFVASANAVKMVGATPVFIDSTSHYDFNLDPEVIERKITSKTKAIIVVHYGGYSADMDRIMQIAHSYGIKVVEDVAHGPFVKTPKGFLGTIGDIGCFSFFSTKNITTGEGGMLVTSDSNLHERARLFRSHSMSVSSWEKHKGRPTTYDVKEVGMNYRTTDLASAIGIQQIYKYKENQKIREALASEYRINLRQIKDVTIPFESVSVSKSSHHIFPIILPENINRDLVISKLKEEGIQTSVHYPPCHLFTLYRQTQGTKIGDCPIAEEISDRELTLPLHPNLNVSDIHRVCCVLEHTLKENI
ncbi:DegT/DnrJ/EryC1/StrS family aminotransferase [Bacillus mycoides]|uniref:DegT/DnrJ/EryC1/StrS family aminotransferase n=1 Tax=Bacillus mycoides TaxID=1405 RepID=UPI0011ECA656|nr:DegT/DnrJ/EryC1/StrS aminotransferase family protein [Bacillus mycoides]NUC20211.1 DegT/DnrJ/EryC1/StrS aminotransferase family protein [Bacillus mycoides]QEL88356.1 DegT/DnrJ/EryC1/StrS aminotransferase family protein [Bacillus mycoides]QWG59389.1 DegT/DnrJ/EryC1/StrS aminotransferase family protein [Bacillus mycoides]QWG75984.1 DegT/DnrJ/EryC1/StrS aminotransferase family protein [Bacillus mycoides]QWH26366.1 DegT/DnrJ/EryC1/StrS aminotransferase family protein [Bacillus mycoides]